MRYSQLAVTLLLASCMKAQPKRPEPPAPKVAPATLHFSLVNVSAKDKARIELTADSLLYADTAVPLLHVTRNGVSSLFNPSEKSWGPETFLEESGGFQQSYNLLSRGWLALSQDTVKNLNLVSSQLSSFALPYAPAPEHVLGVGYDFLAFLRDENIHVLEVSPAKAGIRTLPKPEVALKSLQKCSAGCQYWGFDGQEIWALPAGGQDWTALQMPLDIPEGTRLLRVAGDLTVAENGQATVNNLYGLGVDASIYIAETHSQKPREPSWDNVAVVVRQSCTSCHASDGFDQETVLIGLKKEVLRRVDPSKKAEAGAMPPPNSKFAQSFTAADAELMIAWLQKQADTDPGDDPGPMKPTPTPDPNVPIAGDLKKLADTYCVSCHTDNQKVQWWTMRKAAVKDRVESGDMPRNRQMPAAERKKLIDLVEGL